MSDSARRLAAVTMNTRANRQARGDRELFTSHRTRLTAAIAGLAEELLPRRELIYASASPILAARTLRQNPVLGDAFAPALVLPPWPGSGALGRIYWVYPQVLRRRGAAAL